MSAQDILQFDEHVLMLHLDLLQKIRLGLTIYILDFRIPYVHADRSDSISKTNEQTKRSLETTENSAIEIQARHF